LKDKFLLIFALSLPAIAILFIGCSGPPKLGPKPDSYNSYASERWKSGLVDDFRAWLATLDAKSAGVLEKTGEVSLSYQDLTKNDPTHAALVERFARLLDSREASESGSIFESTPDTVTFIAGKDPDSGAIIPGQYSVAITFLQRDKVVWLLSYPLGSNPQ
jgi:hypothetical protein